MLTVLLVPIFEILCPVAKKAMTFSIILMKNIYLNFDLPVQNKLLTNMMFIESRFFFFAFVCFTGGLQPSDVSWGISSYSIQL